MTPHTKFQCKLVEAKFDQYPQKIKEKLLFLRELIFNTSSEFKEIGTLQETLKWNEPAYLPLKANIGSTVRIDWKSSTPHSYYMYFNCKTSLINDFKELYTDLFMYEGNRSIRFHINDPIPIDELSDCIARSLTYHLSKIC